MKKPSKHQIARQRRRTHKKRLPLLATVTNEGRVIVRHRPNPSAGMAMAAMAAMLSHR